MKRSKTLTNAPNKFSIEVTSAPGIFGDYQVRKKLSYIDNRFGITSLLGNIQNTFVDNEENTYVSFSGYPSFETTNTNRSKTFNSSSGVSTNQYTVNINDHNFINGEKVYVGLSTIASKGSSGYYYIKVLDNNNIKISLWL